MSTNNFNWVCFACRTATRKSKNLPRAPQCLECGADCYCLGYKIEVPKKSDARRWRRLRLECRKWALASADQQDVQRVRAVHTAELQIAHLQSLGPNPGRQKLITKLKKEL